MRRYPHRFTFRAILLASLALPFLPGCQNLKSPEASWIAADRARHDVIAPEYKAYVDADPAKGQADKDRRYRLLEAWERDLEQNEVLQQVK